MSRIAHARVCSAIVLLAALLLAAAEAQAFGFDDVAKRAEKLAAAGYQKPAANLPKTIKGTGTETLFDFLARLVRGTAASPERGAHAVF